MNPQIGANRLKPTWNRLAGPPQTDLRAHKAVYQSKGGTRSAKTCSGDPNHQGACLTLFHHVETPGTPQVGTNCLHGITASKTDL
jgi:hypothetical protein